MLQIGDWRVLIANLGLRSDLLCKAALEMTTFVLVHGAWHGSWCWKRVRRSLQARGHEVFTPTLTGVGERSHLLSRDVSLETHILDVVNLIECEELSGI